jgi:ubiquinone/menaquinone biosynthesis C-methylase UbiE
LNVERTKLVEFNRAQVVSEGDTFTSERYRQFVAHLPSNTRNILDVGCNTGRGGKVIKACFPGARITGLDCVPERLSGLDKDVYSDSVCSFTNEIPLPDASFDAVVAGEFIEHVSPTDVMPTLFEFFRLLSLRGRLLLTTPNPLYLRNRIQGLSVLLDSAHVSQHYPRSLRRRLEDCGFSHIKLRGSGRVSKYLGQRFPYLSVYGSYMVLATKW